MDHIAAFERRVTLTLCYRPFDMGRFVKMPPVKSYGWIPCTVHVANINIGPHLECYIMGLQYLYWQTGTDVAARPASGTGLNFLSLFTRINNINAYSSSETSYKHLTATHYEVLKMKILLLFLQFLLPKHTGTNWNSVTEKGRIVLFDDSFVLWFWWWEYEILMCDIVGNILIG